MTADKVRVKLKAAAELLGGQRALARKIGVSAAFLNDIILGKREPSGRVVTYLHLTREVSYEPCTCHGRRERELCLRKDRCADVWAFVKGMQ